MLQGSSPTLNSATLMQQPHRGTTSQPASQPHVCCHLPCSITGLLSYACFLHDMQVRYKHSQMLAERQASFHLTWGQPRKTGYQIPRFAQQLRAGSCSDFICCNVMQASSGS